MTEEQANVKLSQVVKLMSELGTFGSEHLLGTPMNGIFLGLSAALLATAGTDADDNDDDLKDASITLLEALDSVVRSSRLISEIEILNKINDITK